MGNEMSKANARRKLDWRYGNRWLVGHGLDIGCGYDILKSDNSNGFHRIIAVTGYDKLLNSGDAQTLSDVADSTYDFVISSHCLEHMEMPAIALSNWIRVVKPGGFIVVTVPDCDLYEHRLWPSKFNGDHKFAWSMRAVTTENYPGHVLYVPQFLQEFGHDVDIEMMQLLTENYNYTFGDLVDQTGSAAECAIEFVLRKR